MKNCRISTKIGNCGKQKIKTIEIATVALIGTKITTKRHNIGKQKKRGICSSKKHILVFPTKSVLQKLHLYSCGWAFHTTCTPSEIARFCVPSCSISIVNVMDQSAQEGTWRRKWSSNRFQVLEVCPCNCKGPPNAHAYWLPFQSMSRCHCCSSCACNTGAGPLFMLKSVFGTCFPQLAPSPLAFRQQVKVDCS